MAFNRWLDVEFDAQEPANGYQGDPSGDHFEEQRVAVCDF